MFFDLNGFLFRQHELDSETSVVLLNSESCMLAAKYEGMLLGLSKGSLPESGVKS